MKRRSRKHTDSDYTFESVPKTARRGFWAMLFIMLGFTFFSASMSVGATLANGLDLGGFISSVLLGGVFLAAYAGALAYIGCDTGCSFDMLARRSFGRRGSWLPSLLIASTQIGWFGVGAAMFAIPASEVLHTSPVILIIIAGACMTTTAYFGIRGMEIISYISVPLISALGFYSILTATSGGEGLAGIFARNTGGISVLSGVGIVIGSFISGGTSTPNFTRFASKKNLAVFTTVAAFFLGNSLMFLFGAVGGAVTGKEDIFYVMMAQGLIVPALIVLGANIWTTNDNALYSAGLGLSNLTGIRKCPMVIAAGVVGTAASAWLYNNFISWLTFLNASLPPIGAIIILDYFLHRKKYKEEKEPDCTVHWGAVAGVAAGALVGNLVPWGIGGINSMVVACLCYSVSGFRKARSHGRS